MTRRTFIRVAAGVLVALAAGAVVVGTWPSERLRRTLRRWEGFGRTPAARLRAHYSWLSIEPAVFDSYLKDYERTFGPLGRFSLPDPDFYTRFLLSTNFFAGQRRATPAPIAYDSFYDSIASPCYNPLASSPPTDAELAASAGRRVMGG